jgi:nucleoside 2-deoxyribosyltransferase
MAKNPEAPYSVYTAGEMFDQHDLATNVHLKETVWQQSGGRYALVLPQSKEPRDIDRPDIAAHIRNLDLRNVMQSDLVLARFDGLEIDSGTLVEYMLAKFLGKPCVILRGDTRRSADSFDEPYNLMAKNWPRTIELRLPALPAYMVRLAEGRRAAGMVRRFEDELAVEVGAIRAGIEALGAQIVGALDAARALPSPYPEEYREQAYRLARLSAGRGFAELVSEEEISEIVSGLRTREVL